MVGTTFGFVMTTVLVGVVTVVVVLVGYVFVVVVLFGSTLVVVLVGAFLTGTTMTVGDFLLTIFLVTVVLGLVTVPEPVFDGDVEPLDGAQFPIQTAELIF